MDEAALRAWIREHKVCWELLPHFELRDGQRVQVGFELSLLAQGGSLRDGPGSAGSYAVYEMLREIAGLAAPAADPRVEIVVEPFDHAFHLRPATGGVPEVELTALVVHRTRCFEPADAGQLAYTRETERRLAWLGVQPKVWASVRAAR